MAIEFRGVRFPPLRDLTVSAPSSSVIGIIGEKGAGKSALLKLASGAAKPEAGEVIASGERRYMGPLDALQLSPVDILLIEHSLAHHDALVRARALAGIDRSAQRRDYGAAGFARIGSTAIALRRSLVVRRRRARQTRESP